MSKLTKWAQAIAKHEGFYTPGSIADRYNNPGNIIYGPLAQSFGSKSFYTHPKTKHQFAIFKSVESGFGALERLLENAATGKSQVYNPEMTLIEYFTKYSPIRDGNGKVIPNVGYATSVANQIGVPVTTKIKDLIDNQVIEPEPMGMVFYSQNDPRWKNETLGKTKYTMGQFGCTTDCISIGGTWFNENIPPGELCKRLRYTSGGYHIWASTGEVYKRMKFHWRFYTHDETLIKEALKNPSKVVLLNVDRGYHWVFALSKIPILGYRCFDPYPYPGKVRYYKPSEVEGGTVLIKK